MNLSSMSILAQLGLIVVLVVLFLGRRRLGAASRGWAELPARMDQEPDLSVLVPLEGQAGPVGLFQLDDLTGELAVPEELLPLAFSDTCAIWTQMGEADAALDIAAPPAPNEVAWAWRVDGLDDASSKSCTMAHRAPEYA